MPLLVVAMCATLLLTAVNLAVPQVLREMIALVSGGIKRETLPGIYVLAAALMSLYLCRVAFRHLSNFMAHKAAWRLVQELRQRVYDHIQSFSMGFFHNRQTGDLMSRVVNDNFSGMAEIQAFNQQTRESGNVRSRLSVFTGNMLEALNLSAVFHPSVEFLTSLGTVIVVGFGGYLAYLGQLKVEDIVGFMLYMSLFYAPVAGIAVLIENYSQALAGAERVLEILDADAGIADAPGAIPLADVKGEIAFENVSFSYNEDSSVLKDVSFTAKPGSMVALVGPTGVGKTTAIQLAARFYEPDSGIIRVDGRDLRHVTLESLRGSIAMVLQDTFLFTGTIEENISYASADASKEDIILAAKAAGIHKDILSMPDGYNTQVGERGVKLSVGQKQRIAIARAVLRASPILILDEATSSVDAETEAMIQQAIDKLAGTRTIIAIAHRLSTIKKADLILVFENGEIVQRGTRQSPHS
jgi:ATP-binding cassette subfamily B protein